MIVIPSYEPDEILVKLVMELKENEFQQIVVVDDGSSMSYMPIFNQIQQLGCVLITHHENLGKGQALKTGIKEAMVCFPINLGIITVDSDGQHKVSDVVKVYDGFTQYPNTYLLGTRTFSLPTVPLKSYLGNKITSFLFRLNTGVACNDTQTGLRGIPFSYLSYALKARGNRYEYEYNLLQTMTEQVPLTMIPISTVYFQKNTLSHFRPVRDSILIYHQMIAFLLSSLAGFLTDIIGFYFISLILGAMSLEPIMIATVVARILSGMVNYIINKKSVFRLQHKTWKSAIQYIILFVFLMMASAFGTKGLSMVMSNLVLGKILVDTSLFFFSYVMQKDWVFAERVNYQQASTIWKACATVFFIYYVGFMLLNRFVVPQNIVSIDQVTGVDAVLETADDMDEVTEEIELIMEEAVEEVSEPIITATSYMDDSIQITIETIRAYETDVYVAEIILADSASLQAGLAEDSFGTNVKEKTSTIAENNQAILAINGDYYGFRDEGYVMRNGYLYRETTTKGGNEDLVIFEDGSMEIIEELDITAKELEELGAVQIYSFGPGLIMDGELIVDGGSQVDHEDESNPRTAIGMIEPNHYIFLVSDGRTNESEGLTIEEIAIILQSYDCEVAYNLDGGGSSTMVFMGEVINYPTTNGKEYRERSVSDIVYIGS